MPTILVADDSPTVRRIVELTFGDGAIRVESSSAGRAALECLRRGRIDLLLLDVGGDEPTGYEVCRTVKASGRPIPVVLLAGAFEPVDTQRALRCGADAQLAKPFESALLRSVVDQLLAPRQDAATVVEPVPRGAGLAEGRGPGDDVAPTSVALASAELPSAEWLDAVAREVAKRLTRDTLREIAWEVVPDLARQVIRERIRELEQQVEADER